MKKSRFTESQLVNILKEAGVSLEELSRQHGFSKATFYKWKAKYGGMDVSALKRLKELILRIQIEMAKRCLRNTG